MLPPKCPRVGNGGIGRCREQRRHGLRAVGEVRVTRVTRVARLLGFRWVEVEEKVDAHASATPFRGRQLDK